MPRPAPWWSCGRPGGNLQEAESPGLLRGGQVGKVRVGKNRGLHLAGIPLSPTKDRATTLEGPWRKKKGD